MNKQEINKQIVRKFNEEFIEQGHVKVFEELVPPTFINHTAPGEDKGPSSAFNFIVDVLRPAFPDLKVVIHDQVAEEDKVVTHKSFTGTHRKTFMGVEPSFQKVTLKVIDIVTLKDGQYSEHWSIRDFQDLHKKG